MMKHRRRHGGGPRNNNNGNQRGGKQSQDGLPVDMTLEEFEAELAAEDSVRDVVVGVHRCAPAS